MQSKISTFGYRYKPFTPDSIDRSKGRTTLGKQGKVKKRLDLSPLPVPIVQKTQIEKQTSISRIEKNVSIKSSKESNIKGFHFLTDGKNIYISPKIYPKTAPFYRPPEALKKDISIESVFEYKTELDDIQTPKGNPKHPMLGKKAKITIDGKTRKATVVAFDYKERPIVHLRGDPQEKTRIITDPEIAQSFIPEKEEYVSCIKNLEQGKIYKPSEEFCRLMDSALTQPIVGSKNAMNYIDWLHNYGSEVFVLGGAVRDISREMLSQRNLTKEDAIRIVNDIDVSVIGGTQTAVAMFKGVHGDDPDLHVDGFPQYGCVHGKIGVGAGFDFNTMMIGSHTYDPVRIHPDIPDEGKLVPAKFGGHPERCSEALDFCCNALMYDPVNRVIVDPTGYGLEDAVHGFLRLTGGNKLTESPEQTLAFKQPEMLQRFWKFRYREMNSNAYTTLVFQEAAVERWQNIEPVRKYNDIMRMLPVSKLSGNDEEQAIQLENMLDKLAMKMVEDDIVSGNSYKLFERFIQPSRGEIIEYIINRKRKM